MSSIVVYFVFISIVLSFNSNTFAVKLNERRILLPFNNGVKTNFTLEATNDNCYQWSSSRVDVANVDPLDESQSCSRRAVVTVVSTVAKRQSTVVTATDNASGSVTRCDVEIDVIDSIEIITTTRDIVLEDLPEILEVKAKNIKNDTFTSIGGIQFEWTLSPVDILRHKTWSSASYIGPSFVHFWESRDAKGSAILVEGIRTGSAKVTARIVGEDYKHVKSAEIDLHVIANLGLIPANVVYLMRGSKIEFKAEMAKQGPRVALTLPSPQYYLKVLDPKIAQLDEESSQVEAITEGHTSLLLLDRNVATTESSRQPMTEIHVMPASYVSIHVTPGENFALCEFTSYAISFIIHDDWHHRIYPTSNVNLKVTFPSRYFHINESSDNGTHHIVRTINSGNCKISAQLLGAGSAKLPVPLDVSQEVTIYRTLLLTPNLILLPWIPSVKPSYTVFVSASGGTGQYRWVTNNSLVATVSYKQEESARVRVVTRGEGEALISCQDVHNSVFSANMRVTVQPLVDIEILPAVLETHVGGTIILPIAVYGYESDSTKTKRVFDECSQIPFDVEIIEKTRVRYDPNNIMAGMGKRSCRCLAFECISIGNTRVWIRYGKEPQLSTTAIIGCHLPLRAVHPEEVVAMPLGASIDMAFEGGPRPWTLHPEGHYSRLTSSESSVVSSVEIVDRYRYNKDLHVFRVKCLQYGETNMDLEVGNLASTTLPNPANARAKVTIVCNRPNSLIIKPKLKSSCPLSSPQDSVFPIEKNQNPEIEVEVRDDSGRSFYNISTLNMIWNIDGTGSFESPNGVKEVVNGAKGYFAITRNVQIIRDFRSNSVKITAEINGYKKEFRDKFRIKSEIELNSVDKAALDSDNVVVFNHPKQQFVVNIGKGSTYFGIDSESERQYININFKQQSKSFTIIPKAIGEGVIEINDLCLTSYGTTDLHYSVVEATEIRIEVIDKFQLGSVVDGYVSVIDNNGQYIHSSNHKLIDLTPIISTKTLSISNLTAFDDRKSTFKLKGEELGLSSLTFVSQSVVTNYIESPAINIQVFPPLLIVPSNLTLIVGAHFQAVTIGGPQPQRNIEFSLIDDSVARVDSNGLIVGSKLGKTRLIARVLSVENLEYSRSEIDLYVVSLNKIKIIGHTSQLSIGSKLPLHLIGSNEFETPFSFGASIPSLRITWSLSNENIAAIEEVFQNSGIVDNNSNAISVRLRAISAGIVSIKVMVETKTSTKDIPSQQIVDNRVLLDSIQIHVFPSFSIVSDGQTIDERVVLMSPKSQLSLQSNRIGEADSQFQLINATNIKLSCGLERCLKAGESPEVSALVVRTNEKFGITLTSVFSIRVEKISYLMVNPIDLFISGQTINVFPIGSEIQIRVSFHDNIGKTFDSVRSQIRWTLSRNDLLSISRGSDNSTLRIRSLKEGRTLVKVLDSENNIFDYFSVDVGSVIEPNDLNLSVGEVVCLHSKLKTKKPGFWFVENPAIGDVDKESGVFVARSGGHTLVGWKSTDGLSTYTTVDVMSPKRFTLDTSRLVGITNTMSQTIPILIVSQTEGIRQRRCGASTELLSLGSIESPFSCDIAFDNSLQLKSIWNFGVRFDINSGQWMCRFEPKPDINLAEMALINTNLSISVIMSAPARDSDSNYRPLIHTISVPFLPAFDVSSKQVILSLDQSEARLSVHSVPYVLQNLIISSSNDEVIEVSKSEVIENSLKIIIYLKNCDIFSNDVSNLHILLNSKTTKQIQRIPIQIKLFRHNIQQISPIFQILKDYSIVLIGFSTIIAFISYLIITKYFPPKVISSSTTLPSNTSSPFLADIHSPSLKSQRALSYSPSQLQTPLSSTPRVGRPLYSVQNT